MSRAHGDSDSLHFENAMRLSTQMGDYIIQLHQLTQAKGGLSSAENRAKLATLALQLDAIGKETQRTELGGHYRILAPTFEAMSLFASLVSSGLSVAPLAMGLHIASIGINQAHSSLGLFGSAICKVADLLGDGILSVLPKTELGKRKLFKEMILVVIGAAIMSTATILDQRGEENGPLDVELMLVMAINSGLIEAISQGVAEFLTANSSAQKFVGAVISLTQTLMVVATTSNGVQGVELQLVAQLNPVFEKWLNEINIFVSERVIGHGTHVPEATEMAAFIQQGVMALARKDSEIFGQLLQDLLQKQDISRDQLQAQLRDFAELAKQLMDGWRTRKQTIGHMSTGIVSG